MQIQNRKPPNLTLTPFNFSHFPRTHRYHCTTNLAFKLKSKFGFFNSRKRVSKSQTFFKNLVAESVMVGYDDGYYMRKCVEIARKAIGCTSPNPMVGCVIVKDGHIVGQGFHPKAGMPHAEVYALRDAGQLAEGATAYVSLEPCNHYGRTPPCTEALIKAKVKKVVVGMVDPNPIVASKGVDRLRDAGIEVVVGIEEEFCKKLLEAYIHKMLTGMPFVTLRYSLSVNGHFVNRLGEGVMDCGGYYSKLLQEYDAVIICSSLAETFSVPSSQEPGANQPLRIVIATACSSSIQIPSLTEEAASKLIIFGDKEITVEPETTSKGIETMVVDHLNMNMILEHCKQQGLCSVLIDLRGNIIELEELVRNGFEQKLLQKVLVEVLPLWDGSNNDSSLSDLKKIGGKWTVNKLRPVLSDQCVLLEGYL